MERQVQQVTGYDICEFYRIYITWNLSPTVIRYEDQSRVCRWEIRAPHVGGS